MANQPESPRFVLILGGLFLIAYAAYQVGSAWMAAPPTASPILTPTQPFLEPDSVSTPVEPYEPYPGVEVTTTPEQPTLEPQITITPAQPYPEIEITTTPANATPTLTPTNTEVAPTQAQPTATPTATDLPTHTPTTLPTATPTVDPYPGPGQTSTPVETDDPYPGPPQTPTPTNRVDPPSPTPTFLPTPQLNTPTLMPTLTRVVRPTLESTPTPITTLPFTETLIISDGSVNQVVWLDDESELALATSNGLYLQRSFDEEPLILDSGSPIVSVARIPGDDWIAAGGRDSLIRIWDEYTGSFVTHLSGHLLGVVRLSYAQAGGFLASASDDATVRIWDVDGVLLRTLRGPITRVVDMTVSSNGRMVAAASNQHIHIWDPLTGELSHTMSQPAGWYTAAAFRPHSLLLTTAYDGRRLEFWDTATWERVEFITLNAPVQSLAYSHDGRMLAVGYTDGRIQILDIDYQFLLADLAGHQKITSIAFSPFDDQLVTSSTNGSIRIWDLAPLLNPR